MTTAKSHGAGLLGRALQRIERVSAAYVGLTFPSLEPVRLGHIQSINEERTMIEFTVNDMTCGHCVGVVTQAVKSVDGDAKVDVDLGSHKVRIDSARDPAAFSKAITEAGYTPETPA